jgi:alpha-ketoglutarate-dependent taurine dioxygenase
MRVSSLVFVLLAFSLRGRLTEVVTTSIVGMKKEESDMLLGFLVNHIGRCLEHQVRVRWEPGTVVIWDVSVF